MNEQKILPRVSVIMPAYNAQKHIQKAIRSVLSQDYGNFELIVVDDGSQDSTREICERIAAKDSRMKVITQENSGCVIARMAGVAESRKSGEDGYICFLDSDDTYCHSHVFSDLVQVAEREETDILQFSWFDCYASLLRKRKNILEGKIEKEELMTQGYLNLLGINFYPGLFINVWGKFYRKSLFSCMPDMSELPRLIMGEDAYINIHLVYESRVFYSINVPYVNYQRGVGATATFGKAKYEQHISLHQKQLEYIDKIFDRKELSFPVTKEKAVFQCYCEGLWRFFSNCADYYRAKHDAAGLLNVVKDLRTTRIFEVTQNYFMTHPGDTTAGWTRKHIQAMLELDDSEMSMYVIDFVEKTKPKLWKRIVKKIISIGG